MTRIRPTKIILHHSLTQDSQTVSWDAIRRYHTKERGWTDIGYHYGIELIGTHYEVLLGRMLGFSGAHTKGQNNDSVGICFIGNFDPAPPPLPQWELGVRLVRTLLWVFDLKPTDVYGHREFADYKTCPGEQFNVQGFRNLLY